jgi:hypothetical protein
LASRPSRIIVAALLAATCAAPVGAQTLARPAQFQYIDGSCTVSATQFNTWFVSGSVSQGGAVTFADGTVFPPRNNTACDFYRWAHQMFLWITSPAVGGIVLESPSFYDVNFNSNGAVYLPNDPSKPSNAFALRGTKPVSIQAGGQAGGGDTLLSLNGSLVYFGVHANDVYAWFNTAVTNGVLPATTPFPSSAAELKPIVQYAAANGATLTDANAMTLELKSAWVDAATVGDPDDYIQITATVPNYVKTSATEWDISSSQPTTVKTLALVGLHVVGPVNGHPEMVWATFEHLSNAPDNDFWFQTADGQAVEVPYNSGGIWTFMENGGSRSGALVPQMTVNGAGDIVATSGNTIQANDVYRFSPFGGKPDASSAANNSELISLNLDILAMLGAVGDVRANYFQVGAIWTFDGSIPSSGTDSALRGSLALANATMETYHQQDRPNCFFCHASTTSTGTSHLFSTSNQPLVPKSSR